jgi:hypothetical protein
MKTRVSADAAVAVKTNTPVTKTGLNLIVHP